MTDKITLSQDEVEHTNQRYREAHGEAIGRMAAMSVMGSTIEELERENAKLRAELIDNYAASCMDAGVILELRARVGEIEARYDNVTISLKEKCKELNGEKNHRNIWHRTACDEAKENAKLRAELAAIKPEWKKAPGWAHSIAIKSAWLGERKDNQQRRMIITDYVVEHPETDINQAKDVTPEYEPVSMLESALTALAQTAAREYQRFGEFEPQQAQAILTRITWLESRLSLILEDMEPAHCHDSLARIWDNLIDSEYDKQPNVIQQALDSLSPEMRASHFATMRKKQDEQEAARDPRR